MDEKRGSIRLKRQAKTSQVEEDGWECSVCTFKNVTEAFKCAVCDVRKGTATRKPRLNPTVVQQQVTVQQFSVPQLKRDKIYKNKNRKIRPPKLKNIDRASGTEVAVTVEDVTVVITDYKPKEISMVDGNSELNSPDIDDDDDMASGNSNSNNISRLSDADNESI